MKIFMVRNKIVLCGKWDHSFHFFESMNRVGKLCEVSPFFKGNKKFPWRLSNWKINFFWSFLFVNFMYVLSTMGYNLFRKLFSCLTSSFRQRKGMLFSEYVWHTWWWSLSMIADDVIFYLSLPTHFSEWLCMLSCRIFFLLFFSSENKIEMNGMVFVVCVAFEADIQVDFVEEK